MLRGPVPSPLIGSQRDCQAVARSGGISSRFKPIENSAWLYSASEVASPDRTWPIRIPNRQKAGSRRHHGGEFWSCYKWPALLVELNGGPKERFRRIGGFAAVIGLMPARASCSCRGPDKAPRSVSLARD